MLTRLNYLNTYLIQRRHLIRITITFIILILVVSGVLADPSNGEGACPSC